PAGQPGPVELRHGQDGPDRPHPDAVRRVRPVPHQRQRRGPRFHRNPPHGLQGAVAGPRPGHPRGDPQPGDDDDPARLRGPARGRRQGSPFPCLAGLGLRLGPDPGRRRRPVPLLSHVPGLPGGLAGAVSPSTALFRSHVFPDAWIAPVPWSRHLAGCLAQGEELMSGSWDVLTNPPGFSTSTMLLLTDGRVICQQDGSSNWSALAPDSTGSYKGGTWSTIAPMSIYRRYYASAVLASGRVLVAGGEDAPTSETNVCEIYDPVSNTWTGISPPPGWTNIGDAPCAVLDDGRVLLGDIYSTRTVIYDPVADTWLGTGTKGDVSSEETWTLLRDGSVLTVECNPTYPKASQRYVPSAGTWTDAG